MCIITYMLLPIVIFPGYLSSITHKLFVTRSILIKDKFSIWNHLPTVVKGIRCMTKHFHITHINVIVFLNITLMNYTFGLMSTYIILIYSVNAIMKEKWTMILTLTLSFPIIHNYWHLCETCLLLWQSDFNSVFLYPCKPFL